MKLKVSAGKIRSIGFSSLCFVLFFGYTNCSPQLVTDSLSSSTDDMNSTLALYPSGQIIAPNASLQMQASGGDAPYTYSIVAGGGTIGSNSGLFTAPGYTGTVTIQVSDAYSDFSYATIEVSNSATATPAPSSISISFSPSTIQVNQASTINVSGGTPPYTYRLLSIGTGYINGNLFTASTYAGNSTIQVIDSVGASATAAIAIQAPPIETKPVYRFYQASSGLHLYLIVPEHGDGSWTSEGAPFKILSNQLTNTKALYRCSTVEGKHLLAGNTSCDNLAFAVEHLGYVHTVQVSGTVPLYRLLNLSNGDRLASTLMNEGYGVGYRYEGTIGYVYP